MEVCGDAERGGNDNNIFDDVLAFERGYGKVLPRDGLQEKKRHKGGYHVRQEKRDCHALEAGNEEREANGHLPYAEENKEVLIRDEGERLGEQRVHENIGRTHEEHFQDAEPKENNKEGEARKRTAYPPHAKDNDSINLIKLFS